jgi:phospholipid transport system substrate-binding protein
MKRMLMLPLSRRDTLALILAGVAAGQFAGTSKARAALGPAESFVSDIADNVFKLANTGVKGQALKSKFANLLSRYINLKQIANYALGTYRSQLPPAKQAEFYDLVSNYAAALFVFYLEDFRGKELEIISTSTQGKFTTIQSAIILAKGGKEQVRWRLISSGSSYRVADVNLKGIWLTISMKKRFGEVLKRSKGDFEPLFTELREAETW